MICSEARLEANRKNAQKSTGPRTPEGKARSRANGIKHGLCASVVVPEDAALIQDRADAIYRGLKPTNDYQAWHVDRAAICSIRIERCERMERRVRDKIALRAELCWDDDRRLEAEILGGALSKRPSQTVESLRQTPQGCEWLMTRWAMLAHAAVHQEQGWTDDQIALAFDLLATPLQFRIGRKPGASIDFEGNILEDANDSAAVARRMVAELKQRREVVADLDEAERALTEADLTNDAAELRRLRRYESTLHNRLRWSVKEIGRSTWDLKADPALRPGWTEGAIPTPKPEPKTDDELEAQIHDPTSPHPPFDLTPDEFPPAGQKANIEKILKKRREKRRARAEAKREAKRKKAENLGA